MSARSIRRHHLRRLKIKRAGYWGGTQKSARELGVVANTPTPCSCWMYGNRRAREGQALQERRHGEVGRVAITPEMVQRT